MKKTKRETAAWRSHTTPAEHEELTSAESLRDAAAANLRLITRKIKDRVIKRMRRAEGKE